MSEAAAERARWAAQAERVTITRDEWGIAHIHGRTDADAVFGMIFAQAEDDFPRIEANYVTALGRTAEVDAGEAALWSDLRARLFADPAELARLHSHAPAWLRSLTQAWADGLNHFLATHPQVRPRVLHRFEPWMTLSFTEGANGSDLSRVSLDGLAAFYGSEPPKTSPDRVVSIDADGGGSNGVALAPAMTRDGHALLLINPHTTFYLRSEMHIRSDEGLNAYGAVTWGQFFVYQGFNDRAGWMHTTSSAVSVDEFAETIVEREGGLAYRYGPELRSVRSEEVRLGQFTQDGGLAPRTFTVHRTHHGPVVRAEHGRWITASLMHRPVEALQQAFLRTKARSLETFRQASALRANSTNNTVFADADGRIALFSPQFVPDRDGCFDRSRPVDGADPETDWRGDTADDSLPHVIDPPTGWVFNVNDGPWWAAGAHGPARADYPSYMDRVGENTRTGHMLRILQTWGGFTLERLRDAAYDLHLPILVDLLPLLVDAFDALPTDDALRGELHEAAALLRAWDGRSGVDSVATTVAITWGEALRARFAADVRPGRLEAIERIAAAPTDAQLQALTDTLSALQADFGDWRTTWGAVNRFQRPKSPGGFDDAQESWPVPNAASQWGALTAYTATRQPGTKRMYGVSGNAFVAVVEFGPRVRALAVSPGGAVGDPSSPHFRDQSQRFAAGDLREVHFHAEEVAAHARRVYNPGIEGESPG